MCIYGLIGASLTHSFSQKYFKEKFLRENVENASYQLFPLQSIDSFPSFVENNPNLCGLNVTIPFKETILPFLQEVDTLAAAIGAVNVLKKLPLGGWKGYNTDYDGFIQTLLSIDAADIWAGKTGLIFGSGGSSRAVRAAFDHLNIAYVMVSRSDQKQFISYQTLTAAHIRAADVLVNCTPVGTWPNVMDLLPIPYEGLSPKHAVIDLTYNPPETRFLNEAAKRGATTRNGLQMLHCQADKAWKIWNS